MVARRSSEDIRAVAIEAAATLFVTNGVAATTIDDIVRETGIARATLYRHAGNKEDLLVAVLLREMDRPIAELTKHVAPQRDLADILVEGVARTIDLIRGNALLRGIVAGADDIGDAVSDEAMGALVTRLGEVIAPILTMHADTTRPGLTLDDAVEHLLRTIVSHVSLPGRRRSMDDRRAFLRRTLVPVFVADA